jgi:hypothetical protein
LTTNNIKYYILWISLISAIVGCRNYRNCDKATVQDYLNVIFAGGQYKSDNFTTFRSYGKDVKNLSTQLLNKYLPDYCFCTTYFLSNHLEYSKVETALAFSKNSNRETRILYSPVFEEESQDFIRLFYGLQVADTAEEIVLTREVMEIISEITYKGHCDRLINKKEANVVSYELWHDELSWRIYDFHFNINHILTEIDINKGAGRGKLADKYKRQ